MEAVQMLRERRSVRKFKNEQVDRDIIKEVVETSSFSPSWMNAQIARYTVIDNGEKKSDFAEAACKGMDWNTNNINNAAGIVVMSYVKGLSGYSRDGEALTSKGDSWGMYDSGIASQTLSLALHEKGIGSVILGIFDEEKASKFLDLSENEAIAAIIPFGYPVEATIPVPPRKSVAELLRFK